MKWFDNTSLTLVIIGAVTKAAEDKLFKVGCVSHLAFNRPF